MHAAEAAGAHEADPGAAADRERAADGRRADRALHRAGGEVARAGLARVGAEAPELVLGEPDHDAAVEHADRRRHGAGLADAPLRLEPDLDALARREAVRDERRLQRDDRPAGAERDGDLLADLDHGIAPSCATQRAAASRPELRPADEEARGERVAGAGRVDDVRGHGPGVRGRRRRSRARPRFSTTSSPSSPSVSHSRSFANTRSGREPVEPLAEALRRRRRGCGSTTRGRR